MTNKQFIKQNVHFNTKKSNEKTNIIIRILKLIEDICGVLAAACTFILLTVVAILTLGGGLGSKYSNRVVDKYGNTIYK
jgi:hypothetical protein